MSKFAKIEKGIELAIGMSHEWTDRGKDLGNFIQQVHRGRHKLTKMEWHALTFLAALGLEVITERMKAELEEAGIDLTKDIVDEEPIF